MAWRPEQVGREIERKFLVTGDGWRQAATASRHIVQAYLALRDKVEVRVRITDGEKASLTIKSAPAGLARSEFEYTIPVADAEQMIALRQGRCIRKRRHIVPREGGRHWEIDVFEGEYEGLRLAEIEFETDDDCTGPLERPDWLGEEVTGQKRYYNAALAAPTGDGSWP